MTQLTASYSDHVPIMLNTQVERQIRWPRKIPKRFEEKWVTHPQCEEIVQQASTSMQATGSPMYVLFEKIKHCQRVLVDWSRGAFGYSKNILREKHQLLQELARNNGAENLHEIRRVKEEINSMLYNEELHWRQRSRSIWLRAGDKNTKFFHQRASQRRRKNNILGVFDGGGQWHETEEGIARVAKEYFQELFTTSNPTTIG